MCICVGMCVFVQRNTYLSARWKQVFVNISSENIILCIIYLSANKCCSDGDGRIQFVQKWLCFCHICWMVCVYVFFSLSFYLLSWHPLPSHSQPLLLLFSWQIHCCSVYVLRMICKSRSSRVIAHICPILVIWSIGVALMLISFPVSPVYMNIFAIFCCRKHLFFSVYWVFFLFSQIRATRPAKNYSFHLLLPHD